MADDKGVTALIRAASKGHGDIVRALLKAGADKTAKTKNGNDAEKAAKDSKGKKPGDSRFDDVIRALTEDTASSSTPATSAAGGPTGADVPAMIGGLVVAAPAGTDSLFALKLDAIAVGGAPAFSAAPSASCNLTKNYGAKTSNANQNSGVPATSANGCGSALFGIAPSASGYAFGSPATPTNGSRTAFGQTSGMGVSTPAFGQTSGSARP